MEYEQKKAWTYKANAASFPVRIFYITQIGAPVLLSYISLCYSAVTKIWIHPEVLFPTHLIFHPIKWLVSLPLKHKLNYTTYEYITIAQYYDRSESGIKYSVA